jgi:hypothetical protein
MFMNCRDMSYRLLQMLGAVAFVLCLPLAILALAILYIVAALGWLVAEITALDERSRAAGARKGRVAR